jgi:hypothetical protein
MTSKNPHAVALGKASAKKMKRTPEDMRKLALKRWTKVKSEAKSDRSDLLQTTS